MHDYRDFKELDSELYGRGKFRRQDVGSPKNSESGGGEGYLHLEALQARWLEIKAKKG